MQQISAFEGQHRDNTSQGCQRGTAKQQPIDPVAQQMHHSNTADPMDPVRARIEPQVMGDDTAEHRPQHDDQSAKQGKQHAETAGDVRSPPEDT